MKDEEEKQRRFRETLLKMLYPPRHEDEEEEEEEKLIESSNDLPGEELVNDERNSSPSISSDDNEGENEKLTRAQRKRLRKRKLKESASQRRKIIGPLLPGSSDVEVVGNVPEGVRQNATTNVSGEPANCSKRNRLRQRRKSKKLSGKS